MEATGRVVVWFSAGAASAVAAKLTLADAAGGRWGDREVVIAYTDPGNEHDDTQRFIADCEAWFGADVLQLRSDRYADCWDVWEKRRFLNSPQGALCTTEMKKMVRFAFEFPDDIQVFGFTAEEARRAERFRTQNPGVDLHTPLIERGLTKDDCLGLVDAAGIEPHAMYRLGFRNANCVGCVKGGMGYWNKIRRDFPEVFERMARLEREIGATVLKDEERIDGRRVSRPLYLDELDPGRGNHLAEPSFECGLLCADVAVELSDSPVCDD